jgi:hypothetical protein
MRLCIILDLCDQPAKVEYELEDVLSCRREMLQTKMQAGTQVCIMETLQGGMTISGRSFQCSAHSCLHDMHCTVIVRYMWNIKTIENLNVKVTYVKSCYFNTYHH